MLPGLPVTMSSSWVTFQALLRVLKEQWMLSSISICQKTTGLKHEEEKLRLLDRLG